MATRSRVEDYNLLAGGSGAHDIKAASRPSPRARPTTFAGWLLAPGSVGAKAADDGADMGILPAPPPPPAPAAPRRPRGHRSEARPMRRGGAPAISIKRPAAGSRSVQQHAPEGLRVGQDNNGIDRVGFWLDRNWIGTDRAAPYTLRVARPRARASARTR